MSEDDRVYLEDKTGKIQMTLVEAKCELPGDRNKTITTEHLVTGIIVGIRGKLIKSNNFEV